MSNPKYRDELDDLLDRPIAYNPAFKRITHSTVASIFLSQCWYWSKRHKQDDGWFYKSQKEWEEETGLTRSEQETARKHCKKTGVIDEKLKGVPATLHYRVNKPRIYELLGVQFAEIPQTEIAGFPQTSSRDIPQFAGIQQSDVPANFNKEPETPPKNPPEISRAAAGAKNIFMLYEENIGALTPMLVEELKEAERKYPNVWFEDGFREAVTHNARNWKYVKAVLERWMVQGKGSGKPTTPREPVQPQGDDGREMTKPEMLKRPRIAVEA